MVTKLKMAEVQFGRRKGSLLSPAVDGKRKLESKTAMHTKCILQAIKELQLTSTLSVLKWTA